MKIAVFLDRHGRVAPLTAPGTVMLFTRDNGCWQVCRQIPFNLSAVTSLVEIRRRTLAMLALLPECRHFVAREIHGALLAWFDGMGLTMWQYDGKPDAVLDAITQRYSPAPAPEAVTLSPEAFVRPGPGPGEFYLDLIAALRCGGSHTSKHLLLPLLQRQAFRRLEIRCDHVPKWFDRLAEYQLEVTCASAPDGSLRVVVGKIVP